MKRRIRRLNDDQQDSHQISGICGTSCVQPMKHQRIDDLGCNVRPRSAKPLPSPSNDKVLHQLQPLCQLPSQPLHLTPKTKSSRSSQLPLHLPPQLPLHLPHQLPPQLPPQQTSPLPRQLPLLTKPLHLNQPFSTPPDIIWTQALSHKLPLPPLQLNFLSDQPLPPPPSVTHVPGPPSIPPPPAASDPGVPPPPPEASPYENGSVHPVFFGNVKEPCSEHTLGPVQIGSVNRQQPQITRNHHLSHYVEHPSMILSTSAVYGFPTSSSSSVTKKHKLYHHRGPTSPNCVEIESNTVQQEVASSSYVFDPRIYPQIQFSNQVIHKEPVGNQQFLQADPSHLLEGSPENSLPVQTTSFDRRETLISRNPNLSTPVSYHVEHSSSLISMEKTNLAPDTFQSSMPDPIQITKYNPTTLTATSKTFTNKTTPSLFYGVPTSSPNPVTKKPKLHHHRLPASSNWAEMDSSKAPQEVTASSSCASYSRTLPMVTLSPILFSNPVINEEPLVNPQRLQADPSHLLDGNPENHYRGLDDCVGIIIGFLSPRDVCRAKAVCHCFGAICCNTLKRFRSIQANRKENEIPRRYFVNVVISNFVNIRKLTVYHPTTLSFSEIKTVVERCPMIESLSLRFKSECALRPGCKPGILNCQDFLLTYLAEKKPRLKSLILHACVDPRDIHALAKSRPSLESIQLFLSCVNGYHAEPDVMKAAVAELVKNTKNLDYLTLQLSGAVPYFIGSSFWKHLRHLHLIDFFWREWYLNVQCWRTPVLEMLKLSYRDKVSKKVMRYVFRPENDFKMTITDKRGCW